ncbi:hypothetical protein [Dyadobacter sp. Leaf189]|uniref:hypothetical protein n=1 Tax=Dyadobacter sp. Leaf189 TaxID=1736295 RepID=UPI0006F42084|nr:hypothetical protein [Dyadobacter sp. Leaf189]KQS34021.1 hypothetical protein ASG33_08300 [Dyadobacter sp. Leaf189]
MAITKDHLKIVEVITREVVKVALVSVAVYAFLKLFDEFIKATGDTKLIYMAADGLFGIVILRVYFHYFPTTKR